jgi:transcriptional regulator with XRE-family HTH domain
MRSVAASTGSQRDSRINASFGHSRSRRLLTPARLPRAPLASHLGPFLKSRRRELGLTQLELSRKLGVRASHIALLENDRRRPSLSLLKRLAVALGVEGRALLDLAYPEIRGLICPISKPRVRLNRSWMRLFKDTALLARYQVTQQELEVLRHLSTLSGTVTAKRLLAILLLVRDMP